MFLTSLCLFSADLEELKISIRGKRLIQTIQFSQTAVVLLSNNMKSWAKKKTKNVL